jgi:hypothetical protein
VRRQRARRRRLTQRTRRTRKFTLTPSRARRKRAALACQVSCFWPCLNGREQTARAQRFALMLLHGLVPSNIHRASVSSPKVIKTAYWRACFITSILGQRKGRSWSLASTLPMWTEQLISLLCEVAILLCESCPAMAQTLSFCSAKVGAECVSTEMNSLPSSQICGKHTLRLKMLWQCSDSTKYLWMSIM